MFDAPGYAEFPVLWGLQAVATGTSFQVLLGEQIFMGVGASPGTW